MELTTTQAQRATDMLHGLKQNICPLDNWGMSAIIDFVSTGDDPAVVAYEWKNSITLDVFTRICEIGAYCKTYK